MRLFELFAHQAALEPIRAYGAQFTGDPTTSPALPAAKSAKQNECAAHNSWVESAHQGTHTRSCCVQMPQRLFRVYFAPSGWKLQHDPTEKANFWAYVRPSAQRCLDLQKITGSLLMCRATWWQMMHQYFPLLWQLLLVDNDFNNNRWFQQ